MDVPHLDRPICEPVELAPGSPVRAEHVQQGPEATHTDPFVHYHDVHELVLFGRVEGHFDTDRHRYPLTPHSIAFIPSMGQHDFSLGPGPRDWVLVQMEAGIGDTLARQPGMERLHEPFCARPTPTLRRRVDALAGWIVELDESDPMRLALAELILRAVVRAPLVEGERFAADALGLRRLRPAIDRLRRQPADAPGAELAAELCALSPAYFSRRFKQQVGMSWSDYVRTHRLHLASRLLLETNRSVARIAEELGFATPSHFGELFLSRFGMTPGAYRQAARPHLTGRRRTRRQG